MQRNVAIPSQKICHVSNGISLPAYLSQETARSALGISPESTAYHIATIAELTHNKNIGALLRAITHLREEGGVVPQLSIIGDGELYEELKAYIIAQHLQEYVRLHGKVEHAATYLRAFDLFVLPSVKEGFGYVLLEAGYAGVPVVASNLPTIASVVGNSAHLVAPTPHALAEGIRYMQQHPSYATARAAALRTRITHHYSFEQMIESTMRVYRR